MEITIQFESDAEVFIDFVSLKNDSLEIVLDYEECTYLRGKKATIFTFSPCLKGLKYQVLKGMKLSELQIYSLKKDVNFRIIRMEIKEGKHCCKIPVKSAAVFSS